MKLEEVLPLLPATAATISAKLGVDRKKVSMYLVHAVADGRLQRVGFAAEKCHNRIVSVSVYAKPDEDRVPMREILAKRREALERLYGTWWMRPEEPKLSERHIGHVRVRIHQLEGAYEREEADEQ